ncbi:N-acetyllactosaminide beta-1,3-N-acetylglucosaminyltransferase 3-like [Betta splendens]|uniref:Hexosyltransferase n=1 Tax=Betta splendens TaxID=158456 RepID=A0A8M1HDM7_BETSP|nr:N-acetyllactosaminide beta-1,3-N-acetylglucosaminyltransferase 3-like [Betta splendens]XP_040926566.1 N-acetyllactosaminide beta-1,3-N-acetylglucosaminyltransferase 3-like [Betta splendens]XP_055364416.1 N-acetyllactosaminide beta-1,3-N-acetylglucosaminyltransferase 3-like [Betta splendens]XP_055364417.1 N-acetyllactosaminide beta-1,3-N-acetylglucosaminyltransferase 3-like [Betta splendens]XP_055364418.1 N-acetyllactosaminide beta-1,3-N-acetylglucosaminyltransferase 3-like [Betta splendens]
MGKYKAKALVLAGVFSLLILHLCKDFIKPKTIQLPVDGQENDRKITQLYRNDSYVSLWPKCEQNTSAANIIGFSSLPGHIQDFLYYRHCRHFPMLLDVPDKCGGASQSAEVFLLLVIKSSPVNYDRREVLRKTWAEEREQNGVWIRRLFISGTMDSGHEKNRLNKLLELEHREHNDILQWDFSDSFFNLTLKQILFLEWMEKNCLNARFLLNGDDDVFANTDNMIQYLQGLEDNNGSKHLYAGFVFENTAPVRYTLSKYFVPVQVQESESYPPYCGGGGFLLSGYSALVINNMSQSITLFPIDDVYMGMCLAKAGLVPVSHMGVKTIGLTIHSGNIDEHDPCYYKELLLVHRFIPAHIYLMWHRIHDPSLVCGIQNVYQNKP